MLRTQAKEVVRVCDHCTALGEALQEDKHIVRMSSQEPSQKWCRCCPLPELVPYRGGPALPLAEHKSLCLLDLVLQVTQVVGSWLFRMAVRISDTCS